MTRRQDAAFASFSAVDGQRQEEEERRRATGWNNVQLTSWRHMMMPAGGTIPPQGEPPNFHPSHVLPPAPLRRRRRRRETRDFVPPRGEVQEGKRVSRSWPPKHNAGGVAGRKCVVGEDSKNRWGSKSSGWANQGSRVGPPAPPAPPRIVAGCPLAVLVPVSYRPRAASSSLESPRCRPVIVSS